MRLLFIHKEKLDEEQTLFVNHLIKIFGKCDFEVTQTIASIDKCDCILLYETYALNSIVRHNKSYNLPIICCLRNSDIANNYGKLDIKKIDYFFLFEDESIQTIFPFQKLCKSFHMPFCLERVEDNVIKNTSKNIFINLGKTTFQETLLKIVRPLNQLTSWNILFNTKNKFLSKVLNNNIKTTNSGNIQLNIQQSNIVIGSGYTVLYAIMYKKPCIVIGDKGYGGLISTENFPEQYKSFFQGRIGGRYLEMLPDNLIIEDLQSISNISNENVIHQLKQFENEVECNLTQTIKEIVRKCLEIKNQVPTTNLIFNSDFTVIKSKNKFWIMNRYNKNIKGWIDEEQYKIAIEQFIEQNTMTNISRKKDLSLVKELIQSKILIPYI